MNKGKLIASFTARYYIIETDVDGTFYIYEAEVEE